jgi:hypothetical protein
MSRTQMREDRVLGSLRVEDGATAVRMEDRFDTDIDDLWVGADRAQASGPWFRFASSHELTHRRSGRPPGIRRDDASPALGSSR